MKRFLVLFLALLLCGGALAEVASPPVEEAVAEYGAYALELDDAVEQPEETAAADALLAASGALTVKKVVLPWKKASLDVGKTLKLEPTVTPTGAQTTFTYTSSKPDIARVDANGVVTALKEGKAKITVASANKKKVRVTITVVDPYKPTKVTVSAAAKTLEAGTTLKLTAVVSPATASQKVTWVSSNEKVATVSADGVVTGVKKGSVKITAMASSKVKAKFSLKVTAAKNGAGPTAGAYELSDLLGKPVSYAKQKLGSALKEKKSGSQVTYTFSGGGLIVASDKDRTVTGVGLDAKTKNYTLFGATIGDRESKLESTFEKYGWYFYTQYTPAKYDVEITQYRNRKYKDPGLYLEVRSDAGVIFSIWVYDPNGVYNK